MLSNFFLKKVFLFPVCLIMYSFNGQAKEPIFITPCDKIVAIKVKNSMCIGGGLGESSRRMTLNNLGIEVPKNIWTNEFFKYCFNYFPDSTSFNTFYTSGEEGSCPAVVSEYYFYQYYDSASNTSYYLTRINHRNKRGKLIKLRLALTDKDKLMGETASEFYSRTKAALVFNASMSKVVSTSFGADMRVPAGIQIIDGKIVQERATRRYTLGIKDNNELVAYPAGTTAKEILNDGINTALTGFVPLIQNHETVSDTVLDDVANLSVKNPRQVICQFDNLDIAFLTCGGRGFGGEGMTAKEIIAVLKKLNVKFAFNLDGGGSISTVVDGKFINWKIDGHGKLERPRANFLYVK